LVFKQNEGVIIISKDCVDIISTSADPTRNFFRVRFRNPKLFVGGKYSTPQWGQKAAMTIGTKYYGVKGCKITMAQPVGGRWMIQNVLIPKNGGVEMTEELALQIANHIQDRIEREGQWTAVMCRDNETKRYISKINGRHIERDERGRFAPHAAEEFGAEWRGRWDVGNERKSGEDYYFTYYIRKTEANPQAFEVLIRGRSPEGRELIRQASKNPIFRNLRYADKIKIGFFIRNEVNWEGNIIKGHYQVYLPKLVEGKRGKQVFLMTPSNLIMDNYGEPVIEGLYRTKQEAVNAIYYYFDEMEYPFHISNWPLENSWEFNWDEEFEAEEFEAWDANCSVCNGTGWMPKKGDPKKDAKIAKLFGLSIDELTLTPCNAGGKSMGCWSSNNRNRLRRLQRAEEFDAEFKGKEGVWLYRYPLSYRPNEQAIKVFKNKEDWLPIWEKLCEDYIQIRNRESLEVFERQMQEKREDFPHLSDNELEEQFPTSFAYWKRQTIQIPQAIDDMVFRLNQEGNERGLYSIDLGMKKYNPRGNHIMNAHTITYRDYHAFVFYPFGDNEYYDAEEFEADTRKYLGVWVQKQGDKHYYLDLDDIFGELRYVPNWKAHGWEHPYWDLEIKGGRARFVKSFNEGVKAFRDEALNMKQTEEFGAEQTQYDVKKGKNGIDYESANYISLHDTFAEAEAVAKRERKNLNDDEVIFIVEESFDDETFALDTNLLLSMGKSQTKETSSDSSFDAEEFEAQQFYNSCSTNQFEIFGRNLFYKCSNLGSVRSQKLTSFSDGGLGSYQGGDYALRLAGGMKKYDIMNTLAEVSQDMQPSSMNDWKEVVSATNQIISAEMAQRRMKS
jgi:hypothetical protein